MNNLQQVADSLNTLGDFLAKRDIPDLTTNSLSEKYGFKKVDLLMLFGGSILHGIDLAAKAFLDGIADRLMIVGGEGHTTEKLRQVFTNRFPDLKPAGNTEADFIAAYLQSKYGIEDFILETASTNCGNNVSNSLKMFDQLSYKPTSIIIMQDSSMQRRMDAIFEKVWHPNDTLIINFAAYRAKVVVKDGQLAFDDQPIEGLWSMSHYITLLMGEIPRLSDNAEGYGPKGKNFIAHVDIPEEVLQAFNLLSVEYGALIRVANDKYKS